MRFETSTVKKALLRAMLAIAIALAVQAAGVVTSAREAAAPEGPTSACRRLPECSTDSDCDERCGVGLGKCVHSSCPVRVCHCR